MIGWSGRVDVEDGAGGRRWHQVVVPHQPGLAPGVALLGFASHAGIERNQGRAGAAEGPSALRAAMGNLPYHPRSGCPLIDAGDVRCEGDALEAAQEELARRVRELRGQGHFPMVLGGGHEVALGSFKGLQDRSSSRLGIINFDAHFDMRRPAAGGRGTSGTPFFQIEGLQRTPGRPFHYLCLGISRAANTPALFDTARASGAQWIEDVDCVWPKLDRVQAVVRELIASVDRIQLSICLDALPAGAAPGVSAPAALGIPPDFFLAVLRFVLDEATHASHSGKLALAEIAELSPRHDPDGRTARLAARIAFEICAPRL